MGVFRSDLFTRMTDTQQKAVEAYVDERTKAAMTANPGLIRDHEVEQFKLDMYNQITGKQEAGYSGNGKGLMANDSTTLSRIADITAEYRKKNGIAADPADSRELLEIERIAVTAKAAATVDERTRDSSTVTADEKLAMMKQERERITGMAQTEGAPLRVHADNSELVKALTQEHIQKEIQRRRPEIEGDTHITPPRDLPIPMPTQPKGNGLET